MDILSYFEKIWEENGLEPLKEMKKEFVECDFFITIGKEKIKLGTLNISKKTEIYNKIDDEINEKYDEDENSHWMQIREKKVKEIEKIIKSSKISINVKEDEEDTNLYEEYMVEDGEPVYMSDGLWLFPDGSTRSLK